MRFVFAITLSFVLTVTALAAPRPTLPASAKKLTGPEIVALYDGATVTWQEFNAGGHGTVTYDLKKFREHGTATFNGKTTEFTAKIHVRRNQFCQQQRDARETCVDVYVNGRDIYEVDPKKGVVGKSRKI